jgi:hypothetical protein
VGSEGSAEVYGGDGNDSIDVSAYDGDALVQGNAGDDSIDVFAAGGGATVYGGSEVNDPTDGADTIDVLVSGGGSALVYGNGGDDDIDVFLYPPARYLEETRGLDNASSWLRVYDDFDAAARALRELPGVKRRQELIGVVDDVRVYEDFAHHPTAVRETLHGLREKHPEGKLVAAFEPRSRRPPTNPRAIDPNREERIIRLRKTLHKQGYDAGAATIAEHLRRDPDTTTVPAVATIWRVLSRRGFITPQPQKRPRSSWKRFEADMPNQCW